MPIQEVGPLSSQPWFLLDTTESCLQQHLCCYGLRCHQQNLHEMFKAKKRCRVLSHSFLHPSRTQSKLTTHTRPPATSAVEQILEAPTSAFLSFGLRRQGAAPKLRNLICKQTLTSQGSTRHHCLQDPDLLTQCQRDISWRDPQSTTPGTSASSLRARRGQC